MYCALKILSVFVLLVAALTGLPGCSDTLLSNKWAREVSNPDVWPLADAKDDMWLKKIDALPLELHLPDLPDSEIKKQALFDNKVFPNRVLAGSEKDAAATQQRIVLYIDGDAIPIRDDFCSVNKQFRKADVISDKITLRAALCDGPRILTYGNKKLPMNKMDSNKINSEIVALSHSLVGALYPPLTDEQEREVQSEQ